MRHALLPVLMLVPLLIGIGVGSCAVDTRVTTGIRSLIPDILRVEGTRGAGSAVPIIQDGEFLWLLSCNHNRPALTAGGHSILYSMSHPSLDLALFKVRAKTRCIPMATQSPRPGQRLHAVGWHLRDFLAITDGRARADAGGMTCPILFGSSGGAVLNSRGELVGIIAQLIVWEFEYQSKSPIHIPAPFLSNYVPLDKAARKWISDVIKEGGG